MHRSLRYKGYVVAPTAQPLPNGLYAANLTIGTQTGRARSFDALDYFFDEEHALAYAFRWARMWINDQRHGQSGLQSGSQPSLQPDPLRRRA